MKLFISHVDIESPRPEVLKRIEDWEALSFASIRVKSSRDVDDEQLPMKFSGVKTIARILDLLLQSKVASKLVSRIRFYVICEDTGRLVSCDESGHTHDQSVRIRLGNISERWKGGDDVRSSFKAIEKRKPVIVVTGLNELEMEAASVFEGFEILFIEEDPCSEVFEGRDISIRIDIPTTAGGVCFGKVSCDLDGRYLAPENREDLIDFISLIKLASPSISNLMKRKMHSVSDVWDDIHNEISRVSSVEELYKFLVYELTRRLRIRFCSVFTLVEDKVSSVKKLVLRKTSYGPSKKWEDGALSEGKYGFYRVGPYPEKSLTTSIFILGRPVRLQEIENDRLLACQLGFYGLNKDWSNKIQDSNAHKGLLAIPIVDENGRPFAMIRFSEKEPNAEDGYFTLEEERALTLLSEKCIGPKLVQLMKSQASDNLLDDLSYSKTCELVSRFSRSDESVEGLCSTVSELVGGRRGRAELGSGFLYILNRVDRRKRQFYHSAIIGGQGKNYGPSIEQCCDLNNSLTLHALREAGRSVFVCDFESAEMLGVARRFEVGLQSAIACSTMFRGDEYVIVVKSDRLDLYPEIDGRILGFVGKLITNLSSSEGLRSTVNV